MLPASSSSSSSSLGMASFDLQACERTNLWRLPGARSSAPLASTPSPLSFVLLRGLGLAHQARATCQREVSHVTYIWAALYCLVRVSVYVAYVCTGQAVVGSIITSSARCHQASTEEPLVAVETASTVTRPAALECVSARVCASIQQNISEVCTHDFTAASFFCHRGIRFVAPVLQSRTDSSWHTGACQWPGIISKLQKRRMFNAFA